MNLIKILSSIVLTLAFGASVLADVEPKSVDAAHLKLDLKKLTVLGSVLYIGAHPDDENTAVLAYLSLGRALRTAYLSLTRGDGGQNLIGPEQGEKLGIIRTQELLAARQLDGAEQYFTRAIDFGYSKTPEETIRLWGRDKVLSDVVWVIRRFRPDVIILRFPAQGGGHGHHAASGILGKEAYEAAADPKMFPEQLRWVKPWRAKRLLWNSFGRESQTGPDIISIDVGGYNPLLGESYREIAGQSRSMHKSQGMGAPEIRGPSVNTFERLGGEPFSSDLMDGVDTSWGRIPGGEPIGRLLERAYSEFHVDRPWAITPILVEAYSRMAALKDDPWIQLKMRDTLEAIRLCSGLWLEAITPVPSAIPGQTVEVRLTAINRSSLPFQLMRVELAGRESTPGSPVNLADNIPYSENLQLTVPSDASYSQPYWLRAKPDGFTYRVEDQTLVGLAEEGPPFSARVTLRLGVNELSFDVPVLHRWTDPVEGERYLTFEVSPEVSVAVEEPVMVFADTAARTVRVTVTSEGEGISGDLRLSLPGDWTASPAVIPFAFKAKGETRAFDFQVAPVDHARIADFLAVAEVRGKKLTCSLSTIDYRYFPPQTVLTPADGRLLRLDLKKVGSRIGYVMGSGDLVPQALREMGYEVTLLSDEQLVGADLSSYDAIVTGIRAYNTREMLAQAQSRLLDYVRAGGTLVEQYNTPQGLVMSDLGPYPFRLSRERVSVEDTPVTFTADHPLMTAPNRIEPDDFAAWVQERGLNFPAQWDPRYQTPVSSADPGEAQLKGGILFARYGKGVFIYTAYSWFRELPAGVPGAYRLFANLVSARGADGD
jgi:LmbE family N-acetylglucosaminyl deacetylase